MFQRKCEEIIDREKYAEKLLIEIINSESNSNDALNLYGQPGIGKLSLSQSLYTKITQYYSNSTVINGEDILNNYVISNPVNATLLQLRKDLLKNDSQLSCFDISYLLYEALANASEAMFSEALMQKIQVLQVLEIVKKGLYQFPLLLEATKSLSKNQSQQEWEPLLLGNTVFSCLNWFFIQQTGEIRQWWKLKGSQDLQELKDCISLKDIQELLPLFLARDLQLHLQQTRQKVVVVIENYKYLTDAEGECNWLKDLIQLNPSILWVIFTEKPLNLTNNTLSIAIQNFSDTESQAIMQKMGVENPDISRLIIQASGGIPLYLDLGIETYLTLAKQKTPQVEDFARNLQEVLPKLNAAWDWYERRIWQILSNCRSWDEVLFAKLMSQFEIYSCDWICDYWKKLFREIVKSPFVKLNSQGLGLHPVVEEYLSKNQPDNLRQSVNSWLFEYYQSTYGGLTSVELPFTPLQLSALVKSLKYGLKSQQQQRVTEWFLQQIRLLSQAGRHEFAVFAIQILLEHQQNALAFSLHGKSLFALGNYQQAVIALQTAQKLGEVENLPDIVSKINLQLAACYLKLQRISDAHSAADKFLSISTNYLNKNSIEIAEALNIQAEIAVIEGCYSQALELSQKALEIFKSHQNVQIQLAQIKFTIAWLNALNKNYEIAQKLFKQTAEDIDCATHPLTIYCHGMLGNIYQNMGYSTYQQAYEEYKLALETAEINLGLTHPQTLQLNTAIISFSRIRGEYDTVDFLTQRRHANMEISNFEETPDTAHRLNKIGSLLYQQGNFASSEQLLQQALEINCKILSEKHPQTAETFHNLGLIYKTKKRYYTSEVYFKQALQIRSQIFGEQHPITANTINSLAALYCCMGKYQKAKPLLEQALKICQQNFGEMHPHTATTLNNLAQMYQCLKLSEKAEPIFQQALDICRQVLGEEHSYTKTVESNLNRLREGEMGGWGDEGDGEMGR